MVANWLGIQATPDGMIRKAGLPIGRHSYTFAETIQAAQSVGLKLEYHSGADWPAIQTELDNGNPVISLLRYGKIPDNQDNFDGSHFWVCVGYDSQYVYVNDPNYWEPRRDEGNHRAVLISDFVRSIGTALIATGNSPYQSMFVV